jgi:hypothetical protein
VFLSPSRNHAIHVHEGGGIGHGGLPFRHGLRPVGLVATLEPDFADPEEGGSGWPWALSMQWF